MKIGLYFGSFNPVHHGHLMIASHVVNRTELQQVWFVVSPQNPYEFSIIMGSDGFINIARWKNAEVLLKKYAFYVYLRPGFEKVDTLGANVTILNAPLLNISATGIRENIKDQKTIRYLVPENVRKEIEDHHYYK